MTKARSDLMKNNSLKEKLSWPKEHYTDSISSSLWRRDDKCYIEE